MYQINHVETLPELSKDCPLWATANELSIDQFHENSSDHRPLVKAKMVHDNHSIQVLYMVEDQYLIAKNTELHSMVCQDSCVEFFVQPDASYFNFEMNAAGTLHVCHIKDCTPVETGGFADMEFLSADDCTKIEICSSLSGPITDEIAEETSWWLAIRIPAEVLGNYCKVTTPLSGQIWTANFYKCADNSSHPHWASWNNIGEQLAFHKPDYFAGISFE